MTTAPAITRCPHRNVKSYVRRTFVRYVCHDCHKWVRPSRYVSESQPLPDELALMDFAARVSDARRDTHAD